jgi:hypothetical protein
VLCHIIAHKNTQTQGRNMIIYVIDTTLKPAREQRFGDYNQLVRYLEGMSQRAYGQNRKQRMIMLEEIGHGYDDSQSVSFVRSMQEAFDMGMVRPEQQDRHVRCDLPSAVLFKKDEFGS